MIQGFMVFLGLLYLEDSVVVEIGFNAGHSCLLMLLAHPKLQVTQLYDAALNLYGSFLKLGVPFWGSLY